MKEHRNISIADQIFEQLETEILSGKYHRGDILNELRLSREMEVSRTPIREALLRLGQENMVRESGRGMVVVGITREDMLDMYDVRLHLEGEIARRTAVNIQQEQLAKLCNVSRQTISAIEKGDYNPTINLCIAICKALDKTLDELFWE